MRCRTWKTNKLGGREWGKDLWSKRIEDAEECQHLATTLDRGIVTMVDEADPGGARRRSPLYTPAFLCISTSASKPKAPSPIATGLTTIKQANEVLQAHGGYEEQSRRELLCHVSRPSSSAEIFDNKKDLLNWGQR